MASRPPVLFWIPTLLLSCTALVYLAASTAYPFYFMWDMDHITAVDLLLIGEGNLPMHVNHPGFGMYLLLHASQVFAKLCGVISAGALGDVQSALHPLLCMAELTNYLRSHSPLIAILIVLVVWRMVVTRFALQAPLQLLVLLVLITQPSLLFQATLIRSELYSMFFWVVGVALLCSRHRREENEMFGWGLGAGVCLGVALLTKLQCIFLIGMAFLLDCWLMPPSLADGSPTPATRRLALLLLVGLFGAMGWAATGYTVGRELATFAPSDTPSAMGILLVLWGVVYLRTAPHCYAYPVVLGLMLSPVLHLAVYADPYTSLTYVLTDLKMAFFRPATQSISYQTVPFSSLYALVQGGLYLITFSPARFLAFILSGWYGYRHTAVERRKTFLLLLLLLAVHYFFAIRLLLRDQLMQEIPVVLLCLVVLAQVSGNSERRKAVVLSCSLGLLVLSQLCASTAMLKRSDANYHEFGWNVERFYTAYEEGGTAQAPYRAAITAAYSPENIRSPLLSETAAQFHRILSDVRTIVWNGWVPAMAVGVAHEGMRAQMVSRESRFQEVPATLRGSVVVELAAVQVRSWHYDAGLTPRDQGESLDLLRWDRSARTLSLIPRRDRQVYLFLPEGTTPSCSGLLRAGSSVITASKDQSSLRWFGYTITAPCNLPTGEAQQGILLIK